MHVVPAVACKGFFAGGVGAGFGLAPEPREVGLGALGFFASVFVPFDVGFDAEESGSLFGDVVCREEGADVEADAVV